MSRSTDPDRWQAAHKIQVGIVYDYLVDSPEGTTIPQMCSDLEIDYPTMVRRIRDIRLVLKGDTINLVCDPAGPRDAWLYRLVGNPDDARRWSDIRLGDLETRLVTLHSVAHTLVNATDVRHIQGKRARQIENGLRHMIENLELI